MIEEEEGGTGKDVGRGRDFSPTPVSTSPGTLRSKETPPAMFINIFFFQRLILGTLLGRRRRKTKRMKRECIAYETELVGG